MVTIADIRERLRVCAENGLKLTLKPETAREIADALAAAEWDKDKLLVLTTANKALRERLEAKTVYADNLLHMGAMVSRKNEALCKHLYAAEHDLRRYANACGICKHYDRVTGKCRAGLTKMSDRALCVTPNNPDTKWEWRGECEENGGDKA